MGIGLPWLTEHSFAWGASGVITVPQTAGLGGWEWAVHTCTSHREVLGTAEVAFVESLESRSPTMQRTAVVPQPWLAERTVALPGPLTCCTNLSQPQLSTLLAERLGSPLAYRRTAKLTLLTASEALVKEEL